MRQDELGLLMRRRLEATIDELSEEFHGVLAPGWNWIHTHHAIGYRLEPKPQEEGP